MSENTQNKLEKNDLQLLLRRRNRDYVTQDTAVLTISSSVLEKLGLKEDYCIEGVGELYDGWSYHGLLDNNNIHTINSKINIILQAAIVNAEQRKAVGSLIERVLFDQRIEQTQYIANCIGNIQTKPEMAAGDSGIILEQKTL